MTTSLVWRSDLQVCCNPVYSGTHSFVKNQLTKWNIEVTFVPAGCSVDDYKKALRPNTKVWHNTPFVDLLLFECTYENYFLFFFFA